MGVPAKEINQYVAALNAEISSNLEAENQIGIQGFGIFDVKKKLEHVVVNPSTRQRMLVPPKMEIKFKPSATLKDRIN